MLFSLELYLRFINSVRSLSAFLQVWFCPIWFPCTPALKIRPHKPHGTPVTLRTPFLDTLLPASASSDRAHWDLVLQFWSSIQRLLGNVHLNGRHRGDDVSIWNNSVWMKLLTHTLWSALVSEAQLVFLTDVFIVLSRTVTRLIVNLLRIIGRVCVT